jgi:putative acyl-CoA dehydrogenase
LQASLLIRYSPSVISEGFCASRLAGGLGAFGMLPPGIDANTIVARAAPVLNT